MDYDSFTPFVWNELDVESLSSAEGDDNDFSSPLGCHNAPSELISKRGVRNEQQCRELEFSQKRLGKYSNSNGKVWP